MPADDIAPESSPIRCPKCDEGMHRVHSDGVTLDRCDRCAGFWLDSMELERLVSAGVAGSLDALKPASATAPRPRVMLCPRDGSRLIGMVGLNQPQVAYERCNVCGGMFLDAGELADLGSVSIVERLRRVFSFG